MNADLTQYLPAAVIAASVLTIMLTEIIKRADKMDRLKGYRIYIPAVLSALFSVALAFGEFYIWKQAVFYWAAIFAVAVFGYEAVLSKIKKWIGNEEGTANN